MSEPVRQHFIPRSYLRNFSVSKKDNYFVEAYNKANDITERFISINNLCVQKHIYTIESNKISDKYILEKHYADNVDGIYPEVYQALIDPTFKYMSVDFKTKILYTCLSLYFRTPKFLNQKNQTLNTLVDKSLEYADEKGYVCLSVEDDKLKFHVKEAEEIKIHLAKNNKSIFLFEHLQNWIDFVKYKSNSVIGVIKIEDTVNLITSDNPVNIDNNLLYTSIFNPNGFIRMPLDQKHFLEILPSKYKDAGLRINRLIHGNSYALTTNDGTFENAEKWILGYPETVEEHLINKSKFITGNPDAEEYVRVDKLKAEKMVEFLKTIQMHGVSYPTIVKLKEILSLPEFEYDKNLLKYKEDFIKRGIWIW